MGYQITGAIANSQIYDESQEDYSRLSSDFEATSAEIEVVNEIARIMTSTLDIEEVYSQFCEEVNKLVESDRIIINIIEPTTKSFQISYLTALTDSTFIVGEEFAFEATATGFVFDSRSTLIMNDIKEHPEFLVNQRLLAEDFESVILLPLFSKELVIGILAVCNKKSNTFGDREQVILERLAAQIAPAIENSKLYQRLQDNLVEMAAVDEVAKIITSTLDANDVYDKFASEVEKLVDFDLATINLVDTKPDPDIMEIAYFYGRDVQHFSKGQQVRIADTQSGWVIANHETYVVDDMAEKFEFEVHRNLVADGLRSLITLPLITKGNTIGTFTLASNRSNAFGQKECWQLVMS